MYLRLWTMILLVTAFVVNMIVLGCVGTSLSITIILGTISIFVPNGYLLYNFAGTLVVDLPRRSSKILFLSSTLAVNTIWLLGNVSVILIAELDVLPQESVIKNIHVHYQFVMGMNIALAAVGVISSLLGLVHWFCCIERLFLEPEEAVEMEQL